MKFQDDDDENFEEGDDTSEFSSKKRKLSESSLVDEFETFNKKCPDGESWFEVLIEMLRAIRGLTCSKCKGHDFEHTYGARFSKCKDCNTVKWLTAEFAFFRKLRLPKAYLFMIYLKEKGYGFSASRFATLMKISISTVWAIDRKIDMALFRKLETELSYELVDSASYNDVYMRRSTCTPANAAAVEEQAAMEEMFKDQATNDSFEENAAPAKGDTTEVFLEDHLMEPLTNLQNKILAVLTNKPLQFEALLKLLNESASNILAALTFLELDGLIDELPGQHYVKSKKVALKQNEKSSLSLTERTQTFIVDSIDFIKEHFQGVSRKYIQLYVVDYWRAIEKRAGGKTISIFEACFDYAEVSRAELKAFVSPLKLKIFDPIAAS